MGKIKESHGQDTIRDKKWSADKIKRDGSPRERRRGTRGLVSTG
jgi:hypothetical protein